MFFHAFCFLFNSDTHALVAVKKKNLKILLLDKPVVHQLKNKNKIVGLEYHLVEPSVQAIIISKPSQVKVCLTFI